VGHLSRIIQYSKDNNKLAPGRLALITKREEGLDVSQFGMFGLTFYSVSDPDMAEEVMKGDPHQFTKASIKSMGQSGRLAREIFGDTGLFFTATDAPEWGIAHRILKAPFSTKGMKNMMPMMCIQADKLVEALKREVGYGGVTHIDKWVTKMAFETIAVCGLGTSFGSFDDCKEHSFIAALNGLLESFGKISFMPWWLWWLFPQTLRQLRENGALMRSTCSEVIAGRREGKTATAGLCPDLLDLMLNERDPQTGEAMTETMIIDNVLTFLLAGQDSTAAAMATCLCLLNSNPEAKAKLTKEIDEVVGSGQLEWEHLSQLTYLDRCIRETLRLVPPASAVVRTAKGEQLLGGRWRIPDGGQVMVAIMAMHYSEALWGADAAEFRPERWEKGAPHKMAFLPFSLGPRACTGREFTLVEQKVTLVKLLQHFDFRRPAKVVAEPGYHTVRREDLLPPLKFSTDVEFKPSSAFSGVYSAFELLERGQ